jgi:starch synthase (maltosyl-transferring)
VTSDCSGQGPGAHQDAAAGARVIIEDVRPGLAGGCFPVKRVVGEELVLEAAIFAEADQAVSAVLKLRPWDETQWSEIPMSPVGNDLWKAVCPLPTVGCFWYTVEAWIDPIRNWYRALVVRTEREPASQPELEAGIRLVRQTAERADREDAETLLHWVDELLGARSAGPESRLPAMPPAVSRAVTRASPRPLATTMQDEIPLWVEPTLACFGAWYQIFPRSCSNVAGRHGTLRDLAARLERIAAMGFDVVCVPPIHPIGKTGRKGRRGSSCAQPGDPGSPWAVGGTGGGHKALHPELGTLDDFRHLVETADRFGMKLALDIALHCSPDHPYVSQHPDWFRRTADGSIECAADGANRYQDVYPLDFYPADREQLWQELKSIFDFWIQQGVQVFRVDNPHTKPFAFWRWLLTELKRAHPELVLLSEGLTRPRLQHHLCKLGFSLTYDYFPWRTTKQELAEYYAELAAAPTSEYLRPVLWPSTPQYLPPYLQHGGRAAFIARFILAATLGASYGIYGPVFELCHDTPEQPGSTEYADSEQFALRVWDEATSGDITRLVATVNRIRRENDALKSNGSLLFHETDNPLVIAYSKTSPDLANALLMLVSLDPHFTQSGWVTLALDRLGLSEDLEYGVEDLLTGTRDDWRGTRNYFRLEPGHIQAHLLRILR